MILNRINLLTVIEMIFDDLSTVESVKGLHGQLSCVGAVRPLSSDGPALKDASPAPMSDPGVVNLGG